MNPTKAPINTKILSIRMPRVFGHPCNYLTEGKVYKVTDCSVARDASDYALCDIIDDTGTSVNVTVGRSCYVVSSHIGNSATIVTVETKDKESK